MLEHLSSPILPWGIPDSGFMTTGLEKSHLAQNELYRFKSWPPNNLCVCVVMCVPTYVYCCPCSVFKVDLPARTLCQVCVVKKSLPVAVRCSVCWQPMCGHWGTSPCQHLPSAKVLAVLRVRSSGGECQAKITHKSHTHTYTHSDSQTHSSH